MSANSHSSATTPQRSRPHQRVLLAFPTPHAIDRAFAKPTTRPRLPARDILILILILLDPVCFLGVNQFGPD